MVNDKIGVEPVFTVDGSVNLKTGNIIFLGTVVVTGTVEEGFSIKATGNIEVKGTVDKADLTAEGDIVIRQGITGKAGTTIEAGGSVWAKFIENARVNAGKMVIVSDDILNSQIDATKRIICNGKRATIIGGRLRASEEIMAKTLGSAGGSTETVLEVGYDPSSKAKLEDINVGRDILTAQLDEVQLNLQTLETLKEQRGQLSDEKEAYFTELTEKRQDLISEMAAQNAEAEAIKAQLNSLKNIGRISASGKVYPGVRVIVRDLREVVRSSYKAVSFVGENGVIRTVPFVDTGAANKASDR
jgi:uncharacterized protein (DUF342 family)